MAKYFGFGIALAIGISVVIFWPAKAPTVGEAVAVDTNLRGRLDSARMIGASIVFSYFADEVGNLEALDGADQYCGGVGRALVELDRGEKAGRAFNRMTFTCP